MPKRTSEQLIQQLLREDLDSIQTPETLESEEMAIRMAHDLERDRIKREFGPEENLDDRKKIIFKQKMEYETGLFKDRMNELQNKKEALQKKQRKREQEKQEHNARRKRRRVISESIEQLSKLDEDKNDLRKFGKIRHLQKSLNDELPSFDQQQRQKYKGVLLELKERGHRILSEM